VDPIDQESEDWSLLAWFEEQIALAEAGEPFGADAKRWREVSSLAGIGILSLQKLFSMDNVVDVTRPEVWDEIRRLAHLGKRSIEPSAN
jgi:hypothetical protein